MGENVALNAEEWREFKPGDVVVHPEYGRGIVQEGETGWVSFAALHCAALSDIAPDLRRLVVIDAEDREQVERLLLSYYDKAREAMLNSELVSRMQDTLREFADPEPTKPEEPTGIGAVVVDSSGVKWVRTDDDDAADTWCWRLVGGGTSPTKWAAWGGIDSVRILSEGV